MHEYQLRYLPQFHHDLKEHVIYIAQKLRNPEAASDLTDAVEKSDPRKESKRGSV